VLSTKLHKVCGRGSRCNYVTLAAEEGGNLVGEMNRLPSTIDIVPGIPFHVDSTLISFTYRVEKVSEGRADEFCGILQAFTSLKLRIASLLVLRLQPVLLLQQLLIHLF
jgi:hypothetical protein